MFNHIPLQRPPTPLLDTIADPAQLREIGPAELENLALELRHFLLYTVGKTGGHFSAGLGVIELTIALHYVFNTPDDVLVWDVGHQTYPHKILTGRKEEMASLRSRGGLAPFPDRDESLYDSFGVGHSSTSISAGLGMAIARRLKAQNHRIVAIIGDGAMTAGLAFEALNHLAYSQEDLLVILNDNAMSISDNVGGMARYFSSILDQHKASSSPLSDDPHQADLQGTMDVIRPGGIFKDLGLKYSGPVDGHDLPLLIRELEIIKEQKGPRLLHLITQKGRGYGPAEASPASLHSLTKIEPLVSKQKSSSDKTQPSYSNLFGQWICDMAESDAGLIAITPAMREGSDLIAFSKKFSDRYIDVAIAEQHAVTLAAGLACAGLKPVVAIYSTFLQRGFDQLIHDVAIQNLDVLFAIDRAGLLEDGATHSGVFDIAYLRCIPNMMLLAPADENEMRQLLYTAYAHPGPAAIRYPRGKGPGVTIDKKMSGFDIGKSRTIREGREIVILSFGTMLQSARIVADKLDASLVDMRFIKPLDQEKIEQLASSHTLLVTLEEHVVSGGAGSAVNEHLAKSGKTVRVLNLGIPDRFIAHGKPEALLSACKLDVKGIIESITLFNSTGGS